MFKQPDAKYSRQWGERKTNPLILGVVVLVGLLTVAAGRFHPRGPEIGLTVWGITAAIFLARRVEP